MSIGSAVFVKDGFKLEEVDESKTISVDVVSSVGRRNYLKRSDLTSDADILASGSIFDFSRTSTGVIPLFQGLKLEKGKYIYHIMMKKPVGDSVASIRFHKNNATVSYYGRIQEVDGEWNRIEIPIEVTDESDIYGCQIYNHAFGADFATIVEVMHPMIEKGNKATDWTPAPEDIIESENHLLIDKTNILLSEPLRSIGDVKDRLFRDSDGLWKIERNVGEYELNGKEEEKWQSWYPKDNSLMYGLTTNSPIYNLIKTSSKVISDKLASKSAGELANEVEGISIGSNPRVRVRVLDSRIGIDSSSTAQQKIVAFNSWLKVNPIIFYYELATPIIETLPQADQDKLNNIASYKDSNYLYTIVDKTNILPEYVRDNLKPTLHATFKGGGWYSRFKTEQGFNQTNKSVDDLKNGTIPALKDGLLNKAEKESIKQSLDVISADKKGIDMQFSTVYGNLVLTGAPKTNLNSAKTALNTAYINLKSAIDTVLAVPETTRISDSQMTLVSTRMDSYGITLSIYNQRYEQAQDAISSAYVDDLEIGGRNLLRRSEERVLPPRNTGETNDNYNFESLIYPTVNGQTYTISADVEITSGAFSFITVLVNYQNTGSSSDSVAIKNGKITKTYVAYNTTDSNSVLLYAGSAGATRGNGVIFRNIKIEKGTKATDWTPAPEDVQEEIDDKANNDDLGSVEDSLNDLYTVVNDLDVQTIKDQLAEYQEVLSGVESDSNEAKAQLDRILSEENGALAIINTILNEFNQRWTTLDGFIEINSSETALSISKGNTNMVIDSDSLTFYSGRTPVATITNQYMKIDRGIFVESMQIGRHLWSPSKSNRDHFVLNYVGDMPI